MKNNAIRCSLASFGLVLATSFGAYAATSDTATRPSGNVPDSSMPAKNTPDSKKVNWDNTQPNSKMGADKNSDGSMSAPTSTPTNGSPASQGTKAPATK